MDEPSPTPPHPSAPEDAEHRDRRRLTRLVRVGAVLTAVGALVAIGMRSGLIPGWSRTPPAERYAYDPPVEGELPQLWPLPEFSLHDHRGAELSRASLRGRPFIADFIFTRCTSVCPTMTSRMVQVQHRLPELDLRFVSFSIDPAHDSTQVLAEYAESWNENEDRWSLVPTSEDGLPELLDAFRVTAEETDDADDPIVHSSLFFLVDAESHVRGVYASEDSAALDRLVRDAKRLAGGDASATRALATYESLGCSGCHDNPRLAPPLVGLRGSERTLEDGTRVTVDEAYLRRALLQPGRELVKGYLPLMPGYGTVLTDRELDDLVESLLERQGPAGQEAPEVEVVTDPVCHMRVRAEPSAPHATHEGHEVYFCSEMCRDRFLAAPEKYPLEE